MIELQNWSKVSSGTWKANTIKGASTCTETALRSFWHWKMKSMLTWVILPFLHNQCIETVNTDSRFFLCTVLDISFLVLFPGLATNLNSAVFTTLTHGTLGWRFTSFIKYLTFYPSSFLGWYLFVKGVVRGGEEGGKVWHYRKLEKAVTVNTSMTPSHPYDLYHGDWNSVRGFLEDLGTNRWAVPLVLPLPFFCMPLPKTAQVSK